MEQLAQLAISVLNGESVILVNLIGVGLYVFVVGCGLQISWMPTNKSAAICSVYSYSQQCVVYIDNISEKQMRSPIESARIDRLDVVSFSYPCLS